MSRPKKSIDLDQSQSVPKASQFKRQPAAQSRSESPIIKEATNSAGEVFTIGDEIQVGLNLGFRQPEWEATPHPQAL